MFQREKFVLFSLKIKKFKKPEKNKKPILVGILGGFFGWGFYCQPCLELVGLQHHLPLHHPAAGPAVVGRVQVLVVRGAGQLLITLLLLCRVLLRLLLLLASLLSLLVLLWPRLLLLLLVMSPTITVVVMVDSVVVLLLSVGLAGDGLLGGLAAVHLLAGGGGEEGGAVAVHLNEHSSDIP
jgi:hypothetical protein